VDQDEAGRAAITGLDEQVRRRLYEFVAGRGEPVGRDEAARATGTGRPLTAYHLDKLVDLGLLTATSRRPSGRRGPGAGRPAKLYRASGAEFVVSVPPRAYELAARLLASAVAADPGGASQAALHASARQFGASAAADAAGPAGPGLQTMADVLRAHGYEPFADQDGTIRLRNCPFHQLAEQHRDLVCGMNLALIQGLADSLADGGPGGPQPGLDPRPGCCCVAIAPGGEHPPGVQHGPATQHEQ
jgi:predicted ArsR family transcriptional regulator